MTLLGLSVARAWAFSHDERDTTGFCIMLQIGPLVFEWFFCIVPFWRRRS